MNARENIRNLLHKKPFERVGFHDHIWSDTLRRWINEDYPSKEGRPEDPGDRFGFDIVMVGGIDPMPIRECDDVVEATDTCVVRRNGAGAVLKNWKNKSGAPEHISFDITAALGIIVDAGFDAINPMDAKAGCDSLKFAEKFHDRLSFKGGLDARALESGDQPLIRREVMRLVDGMKRFGAGYIFGSDHSVSENVAYRDYEYAVEVFRERMWN